MIDYTIGCFRNFEGCIKLIYPSVFPEANPFPHNYDFMSRGVIAIFSRDKETLNSKKKAISSLQKIITKPKIGDLLSTCQHEWSPSLEEHEKLDLLLYYWANYKGLHMFTLEDSSFPYPHILVIYSKVQESKSNDEIKRLLNEWRARSTP